MSSDDTPWLLLLHGGEKLEQSICSVSENDVTTTTTSIPDFHNKFIMASAHGWLVLHDSYGTWDCHIWNPVSRQIIPLPRLEAMYVLCVLSKPPTEPDCLVLFISTDTLAFCRIGDDKFVTIDNNVCLSAAISFQGKIYGFIIYPYYHFVTIDITSKKLLALRPPPIGIHHHNLSRPWAEYSFCDYLVESPCGTGEFFLVHKMVYGGYDFRVFRADAKRMEWRGEEVQNIGNRAIFIPSRWSNGFCCYSSKAKGIKPNSIYYTMPGHRNLYLHDLGDRSTTPLPPPCPAARTEPLANMAYYWVENRDFV